MSNANPHFRHRNRSAYELPHLLRQLPADPDLKSGANREEEFLQMVAAAQHAENYSDVLLDGLASLGRVMWSAGENKDWPVDPEDFSRLGTMISQMAVQLQFLNEFRGSAEDRISEAERKGASK